MQSERNSAPPPDLRIVALDSLHAHEEHDEQRSGPLIEKIQYAEHIINPPIVAEVDATRFVILDGANRCYTFQHLGYPHILVQVVSYDGGYVQLDTWQHVLSRWDRDQFIQQVRAIRGIKLIEGPDADALAHIILTDNTVSAVHTPIESVHERNALLRQMVAVYKNSAILNRTAMTEPREIWPLYPEAIALVFFPKYKPADIMAAARANAFLPPGISRHIIHGRALRVNYPITILRDKSMSLAEKNEHLRHWMQEKFGQRQVRYYAEATYQFDE